MKILGNLMLLGLLMLFNSCMKGYDDVIPTTSKNLKDIKVSSSFNWSTSKTVDVNITGLPTETPVISTLIISIEDGGSLYQESHDMSQPKTIQVIVPAIMDQIKLKYGTVEYILPIIDNSVDFSFVPVAED